MRIGLAPVLIIAVISCMNLSCSRLEHLYFGYHDEIPRKIYSGNYADRHDITKNRLSVATYNIELAKKFSSIKNVISRHKQLLYADILCIQEINYEDAEDLARSFKWNYVYFPADNHPESGRDFGNAVFSKFPMTGPEVISLPHAREDKYIQLRRDIIGVSVHFNDKVIYTVSVHLSVMVDTSRRAHQAEKIAEYAEHHHGPCILAGDFNTYNGSHIKAVSDSLSEEGFKHLTNDTKWTYRAMGFIPQKVSLDQIFVRGLTPVNCSAINDRSASDHIPLWCEVSVD